MPHFQGIRGRLSFSSSSSAAATGLAAVLISFIFLTLNIPIIYAQQQGEDQLTGEPSTIKVITTAESTTDNFRLQVPQGWIIQDVKNTGAMLVSEVLEGFGILAQLCPEQQQEQGEATPSNEGNISNTNGATMKNDNKSCRDADEEVIHIIRYPNLGTKLGFDWEDIITNGDTTTDVILAYQLQKLAEVGYRDITIVDSIDTATFVDVSVGLGGSDTVEATVPAKLVEMTYSTNLNPNETRTGYFVSTVTDTTTRSVGTITGYGIFYEGASSFSSGAPSPPNTSIAEEEEEEEGEEAGVSGITSILPPEPVREVFGTFELIAGAETASTVEEAALDEDLVIDEDVVIDEFDRDVVIDDVVEDDLTDEDGEELVDLLAVEVITNGTEGEAPATFVFVAGTIGGTEPYTITWDFDDDNVEESEEQAILHTFEEEGTYNVTVDITDDDELIASDSIEITVEETESESEEEGEEADEGETNNLPTVEIVSNDIEGEAPATFVFRAEIAGGEEPYTVSWDFGDGSEGSDEEIVEHTYDDPGTYNVAVTITDSDGETASDSIEVTIE
jgi:hypothetical protein